MSIGALKTLVTTLTASTYLSGVSVAFGEEMIQAQDQPLPCVVVVPKGGPWEAPGYISGLDPSVELAWSTRESIDVWMWSFSGAVGATAIDHADAVETLRQQVLSAFQDQRNQQATDGSSLIGLWWKPVSGRWEMLGDAVNRYGRAYVLTFVAEIAVPIAPPVEATITGITVTQSVSGGQHVA